MSKGVAKVIGALAAAAALGVASPASATAGNGIRLGGSEGRLHPFVDLEARYDSNVTYTSAGTQQGDFILHFRPGIILNVPGDQAAVDLTADLDWAQYLDHSSYSKLFADANLAAGFNRRGTVGLELKDDFQRSANTYVLSLGSAVVSNRNAFDLSVPIKPGGGALILTLNGGWLLETFEKYLPDDPRPLSKADYNELKGGAELRYKFLPRTAAVVEASYFSRIPNDTQYSYEISGLRALGGVAGLLSTRIAGTLKAGYGDTFNSAPKPFSTWLGQLEVEWLPSETADLRAGYAHDYGVDPGTELSLYEQNRVYLDGKVLLASRYTARLVAGWDRRNYPLSTDTSGSLLRVEPSFEAEATRWLRLSLGYAYSRRDTSTPSASTAAAVLYNYAKSEVWLRGTLTY